LRIDDIEVMAKMPVNVNKSIIDLLNHETYDDDIIVVNCCYNCMNRDDMDFPKVYCTIRGNKEVPFNGLCLRYVWD